MAQGDPDFQVTYDAKLEVGYKCYDAEKEPVLFPFGFGLSYTTYSYSGLTVAKTDAMTISFTVKNTGLRAGTGIAQVYTAQPESAQEPPKRLVGWSRIELAPGESKQVTISVPRDRLTIYNEASDDWKLIPWTYTVLVGGYSQDLNMHQEVAIP